jgi:hypothetical protein
MAKSTIEELGNILQTSNESFYYRHVVMADGKSGDQFHKEADKLAYLDQLYEDGTEVEYTHTESDRPGGGDRIKVNDPDYKPKGGGKPAAGGGGGAKPPFKGKSDYAKEKEAKEEYWQNKTVFEEARAIRNDHKIEFQSIIKFLAPLYKTILEAKMATGEEITKVDVDKIAGFIEAKAKDIQKARNPE